MSWTVLGACSKAHYEKRPDAGATGDGGARRDGGADVPLPGGVCAPGTVERSRGKAEPCRCDAECQTGFCADGLCCSSACDATCMACDLPSSLGDCAMVPAGRKPSDPRQCSAATPATCGQDGTCDGRGGCRLYVAGTECRAGVCDGDRVSDVLTCDGKGQCSQSVSRTCPPYSCDPATDRCATSCTTSPQCAAGQDCVAQRCGLSNNGAVCQGGDDCASGFCVDGVCCNVACSGPCVTCNQTGMLGRCTYVSAGLADPACEAADPSTCGRTGLCDGSGACTLYPENTVCAPSSCSGLVETAPRTCDGRGTCRDAQLVDCAPFLCTAGACATSCDPARADSCEPGHACVAQNRNGVTTWVCGQRKPGQPCTAAADCESGQCVDGVCCESACAGGCKSCSLPGSPGRCLDVAAGAPDPRHTCRDLGAAACSTNGVCDGNGGCQTYAAGTVCGAQSCVAGAYTPPPTCNASGQCTASRSRTCNPFVCNGDVCFTACSSDKQCAEGEFCVNGSCGLKPKGADCTAAKECQSGFCAQGVCCDSACNGACMACDLTASAGTCTAVPDGDPDPQGKCVASPSATCGTTGLCSKGACATYAAGLNCKPAACATQVSLTPASTCDGAGTCVTPADQSCGTFNCVGGSCKTSCTPATEAQDCAPPNSCVNGSCGLKVNGAACTSASQCASGFCTEGVCCNSACADASDGLCRTCKGTRTSPAGTCAAVDSGSADPKSRCGKSNVAGGDCSNDGTCNGAGACRPWSASTGCRQESCTGSTHTLAATCTGAGTCPAAVTASCGAYVCSKTSPTCLNTCTADTDCTGGLTCLKTNNRCGDRLGAGESCVANTDCATGLVCSAEGVCCDKACAGGCQSCKLSGRSGVCSNISAGSAPRVTSPATCSAAAPGACGQSGSCDGSGGCQQRTSCTATVTACPSDPHQRYTTAGACSTTGVCGPLTAACAAGYLCVAGGACATSCTTANASANCDVANGYSCIGGLCQKKANGTACTLGNECATGNCVDGVCCASASCPTCQSCNVAGSAGACKNVPANSPDGTCTGTCPTATSAAGLCDGAGACKPATACAAGYACQAGVCVTSCATNADCAPGFACTATGACKRATGQTCGGGSECASGNCVDGVCCGSAGCPDCAACNVAGSLGTCAPVAAGTADGACVASCVGAQLSGLCDGSGNCRPATACPNGYLCNTSSQCATSCTTSCAAGYTCSGSVCVALKANGRTCAGGGECTSGNCVDGVCCASASCPDCSSCNVTGREGACAPVAAGAADGACVAQCTAGTNQSSGLCDGSGACQGATTCPGGNLCGPNNQCATDCRSVGCASGYTCVGTTCTALKADGVACTTNGECLHGNCVSNGTTTICCSTACSERPCTSRALCNVSGSGCQTPGDGNTCEAGTAACSTDRRSSLSATGRCVAGNCQATATACTTGYLCVGTACVTPGSCAAATDCDVARQFTCNLATGNCEPTTRDGSVGG